jgi:uncharacterized protein YjbI with pentapeptide repeats
LSEANLQDASLTGAIFQRANLQHAKNISMVYLGKAKTLFQASLDPQIHEAVEKDYPHLLSQS